MTGRRSHKLDLGPEPKAYLGLVHRTAPLLVGVAALLAGLFGGPVGTLAALVGGLLAGLAFLTLAKGLAGLLEGRADAARGRIWAFGALLPRQGLLAAALFLAVVVFRLPGAWLLAGVGAWPLALTVAAILVTILPRSAALDGAARES